MSETTQTPATEPEVTTTPAAATPAPAATEAPKKKPGILSVAASVMRDKAILSENLTAALTRAETAETALAELQTQFDAQSAELTELRKVETVLNGKVDTLQTEQQTVAEKATDIVASTGIPATDLPEQTAGQPETLETLRAQIAASSDPAEKAALAAKCREIRFA